MSSSNRSRKYLQLQRTHFSPFPDAQRTLSHVGVGPRSTSSGKSRGMSCRNNFLKRMHCCPSSQACTKSVFWLRERLFTPALAMPMTALLNPGCITQHWVPYLKGAERVLGCMAGTLSSVKDVQTNSLRFLLSGFFLCAVALGDVSVLSVALVFSSETGGRVNLSFGDGKGHMRGMALVRLVGGCTVGMPSRPSPVFCTLWLPSSVGPSGGGFGDAARGKAGCGVECCGGWESEPMSMHPPGTFLQPDDRIQVVGVDVATATCGMGVPSAVSGPCPWWHAHRVCFASRISMSMSAIRPMAVTTLASTPATLSARPPIML